MHGDGGESDVRIGDLRHLRSGRGAGSETGEWSSHGVGEWSRVPVFVGIVMAGRVTEATGSKISKTAPERIASAGQPAPVLSRSLFSDTLPQEEHEQHQCEDSADDDGSDDPRTQSPTC